MAEADLISTSWQLGYFAEALRDDLERYQQRRARFARQLDQTEKLNWAGVIRAATAKPIDEFSPVAPLESGLNLCSDAGVRGLVFELGFDGDEGLIFVEVQDDEDGWPENVAAIRLIDTCRRCDEPVVLDPPVDVSVGQPVKAVYAGQPWGHDCPEGLRR